MELRPTPLHEPAEWDALVRSFAYPHILQSWEWGQHKSDFGWQAERLTWTSDSVPQAAAQILKRSRSFLGRVFSILYVPKGPLLNWNDPVLVGEAVSYLEQFARRQAALLIKIDPDLPRAYGLSGAEDERPNPAGEPVADLLHNRGWRESSEAIQFRNTMVLDLTRGPEAILADMKQKTRYNVRLAARRGVTVRRGSVADIDLLYRMYAETSVRDGFVIREDSYYRSAWGAFIRAGIAEPIIAEVEDQPVAAVIPFALGHKAWYLYGMSIDAHREKMPNYLLQWQAIQWAIERGCTEYDLWGAPDSFNEDDPLWGVYRFKSGFGARVVRTIGPWDWTPRPVMYFFYSRVMPLVLTAMRSRGRRRTAMDLEG